MDASTILGIPQEIMAKIAICLLIAVGAFVLSAALQWPIRKVLAASDSRRGAGSIVKNIIRIMVWGWAICEIINICFNVDIAAIVGALGVVGIAVSLGAQQTIANIIGGIITELSGTIGPGDWISVDGRSEARVIDTNWRRTTLEDEEGVQHIIPNALLVSSAIEKGHPYFMITVPFALKAGTPNVEALLAECEQALLDRMIATDLDCEQKRPLAHVVGTSLGAIQAEVKLYPNRTQNSRYVKRAVLPALIDLLQERDALAEVEVKSA